MTISDALSLHADNAFSATRAVPPKGGKAPAEIEKTARKFESMFVSQMLEHMWSGIKTDGIFGGGSSEGMFRSLMVDEYGKMVANRGEGIGIATAVKQSLLHAQEAK